jgi:hypothetical protein
LHYNNNVKREKKNMNWILTGVLGLLTYVVIRKKNLFLPTASGAFIMAAGILFNVYEKQKSLVSMEIGVVISLLTALLIGFSMSFLQEAFKGIVYRRHFIEPISSFATGTWVAAYSITIITIASWFPALRVLAISFYVIDALLWFGFIILVVRNFIVLLENIDKSRQVNGVIFLSCVAGWSKGLLVYNSTQWAQNFTFGMFMAFTLNLPWRQCYFCGHALSTLWRDVWVYTGIPFLLLLFFIEMALFIKQFLFDKDSVAFRERSVHLKSAFKNVNKVGINRA